jgi:EmrB/QacA subfamily drug resistance transporter
MTDVSTLSPKRWTAGVAHPARRRILAALCLSLLIVVIDNTVLNTALPTLARQLHAGTSSLQWIADAFSLVFAAFLVTAGTIGDRFGRRHALVGGLVLYAAGSTGAALAGSAGALIGWRAVMGVGAAFVMPATLSILNSVFPPAERPQAIALWSAVAGVAVVIGPTLGGFLLAHFAWGAVFWVNVPLAALALAAITTVVPEIAVSASKARLDLVGMTLSALGLLALVDTIIEAPDRGWGSLFTVGELAVAAVVLGTFIVWERRSPNPMIDVRVFTNRAFSAASGALALTFFALFGSLFVLTQYLQLVHGYSTLAAGIRALPFALAMGAVSPVSSVLAQRFGVRRIVPAGLALMAGGLWWLSNVTASTGYLHLAIAVVLMGGGMGLIMAPASESIMSALPQEQAGAGSAINDTVREVGGALGVAVVGSIVSAAYRSQLHLAGLPAAVTRTARSSIAAADQVAAHAGPHAAMVANAAHRAFASSMSDGLQVAAIFALAGAIAAGWALPTRRTAHALVERDERVEQSTAAASTLVAA